MVKIIAFSNQKGGVGKTTTVLNVADYVARSGKKVLMIDIDPQGNLTSGYGIAKNRIENSLYDLMTGSAKFEEVVLPTGYENLDILPCNMDLAGLEVELVSVPNRAKVLSNALKGKIDGYDFVMIDCPPSLGVLTLNALCACDGVIVPIQSEFFALEGLSQLMNTIKLVKERINPKIKVEGVILTMYDGRSLMAKQVSDEIKKYFGTKVFEVPAPRNIKLCESPSFGVPISQHAPKSRGGVAYQQIAEEFLRRMD